MLYVTFKKVKLSKSLKLFDKLKLGVNATEYCIKSQLLFEQCIVYTIIMYEFTCIHVNIVNVLYYNGNP